MARSLFDPSDVDRLARECAKVVARGAIRMRGVVEETARDGRDIAKANARTTARKHGKYYPRSITADRARVSTGFGGIVVQSEYGPDPSRPQGGMSFEFGSRKNQPPHLDLARSADRIEGRLPYRAQAAIEDAFSDVW